MFSKWISQRIRKKVVKENKEIETEHNMSCFLIVNEQIEEKAPGFYKAASTTGDERIYVKDIPAFTSSEFILNEVVSISKYANAVQIEFDRYNNEHNIEVEIYLSSGMEYSRLSIFETQKSPCSFTVSEDVFFNLIQQLKREAD